MTDFQNNLAEERMRIIGMMRQISRATPQFLKALGFGGLTNAEAMLKYFKAADQKLEDIIVAEEKRLGEYLPKKEPKS